MSSIGSISSTASSAAGKITGLASGVDTDKLVEGLLSIENNRVATLQNQKDRISILQSTYQALQASVLDFQSQAGRLSRSSGGPFDGRKAGSSDESIFKAAAGSTAVAGTYTFKVKSLAAAHQILGAGVADPGASLKTGTLALKVGDGATTTVTVDSSNNTLQGLAAAINKSGADVTASVVNDGSTGGTPYRLMLSSKKTGQANDIRVTNNLTTGSGVAVNLDPTTQTIQQGADAEILLGSGSVSVKSATNKVDSMIGGVTLDLQSANVDKTVTLTVTNDTDTVRNAVQSLVDSYNKIVDFVDQRDGYDDKTKQAGTLLGSSLVADLGNQMLRLVGGVVSGVNGQANRLAAIGVTLNDKGKLQVNSTKLTNALSGQTTGVSLDDVRRLFAVDGTSSNSNISFLLASTKTRATTSPIQVNITQAATQASVTAAGAPNIVSPATTLAIGAGNKTLTLSLFGKSGTVTLAEGSYDAAGLAKELQGKINGSTDLGGNQVSVSVDGGKLKVTTVAYGSAASVKFTGGTALADLGFSSGQTGTGKNVAGSFTVNGVTEAATGIGQTLSGNPGNATTDGLQTRVTLTETQITSDPASASANLSVTVGMGGLIDRAMRVFTDASNGRFAQVDKGYQASVKTNDATIARQNTVIAAKREALVLRFAGMEAAVSKLKSLGDSITAQAEVTVSLLPPFLGQFSGPQVS